MIIGFFSLLLVHNAKVSSLIFIDFLFDVFLPYDCLNYCLYENITWKCFSFGPLDNISSDLILKTIFFWIFPAFFLRFFLFCLHYDDGCCAPHYSTIHRVRRRGNVRCRFFPLIFLIFFFSRFTDSGGEAIFLVFASFSFLDALASFDPFWRVTQCFVFDSIWGLSLAYFEDILGISFIHRARKRGNVCCSFFLFLVSSSTDSPIEYC